jgi:hypothetical protein
MPTPLLLEAVVAASRGAIVMRARKTSKRRICGGSTLDGWGKPDAVRYSVSGRSHKKSDGGDLNRMAEILIVC